MFVVWSCCMHLSDMLISTRNRLTPLHPQSNQQIFCQGWGKPTVREGSSWLQQQRTQRQKTAENGAEEDANRDLPESTWQHVHVGHWHRHLPVSCTPSKGRRCFHIRSHNALSDQTLRHVQWNPVQWGLQVHSGQILTRCLHQSFVGWPGRLTRRFPKFLAQPVFFLRLDIFFFLTDDEMDEGCGLSKNDLFTNKCLKQKLQNGELQQRGCVGGSSYKHSRKNNEADVKNKMLHVSPHWSTDNRWRRAQDKNSVTWAMASRAWRLRSLKISQSRSSGSYKLWRICRLLQCCCFFKFTFV